ncbi:MAG: c-type cytochrome [Burkholderiaceae bacterium]
MSRPVEASTQGKWLAGLLLTAACALVPVGAQPKPWADIGRPATPNEIKAWDIDVRADFTGLPPGSGSVDVGMDVWDTKCASCHGTFGESNEVFAPIVGGTTQADIASGRVANLTRSDFPQRTTLMKLSQLATLWDYVNRAMPWNAPKTLTTEEVYAVVAYILNLGDIVPDDFVLSDRNIAEIQQRLPNRNGKVFFEPMWRVDGKPDVQGDACMTNCRDEVVAISALPDFARDAHGNLGAQNRIVGPVRGADTGRPPIASLAEAAAVIESARATVVAAGATAPAVAVAPKLAAVDGQGGAADGQPPAALAAQANCMACHGVDRASVGPAFRQVADRYRGTPGALALLSGRVKNGVQGVWGQIPMPANATVPEEDIHRIVGWILDGAQ